MANTNIVLPKIPNGLATKVGLLATVAATGAAAVAAILDGDHSEETITLLVTAALTAYGLIRGRSEQAAAAYAAAIAPQVIEAGTDLVDAAEDVYDAGAVFVDAEKADFEAPADTPVAPPALDPNFPKE
jgi:hypothetical protein